MNIGGTSCGGTPWRLSETTRRRLAFLLYLGDDDWGEPGGSSSGGELHAYPRRDCAGFRCGAHEGNLQVGWLERGSRSSRALGG